MGADVVLNYQEVDVVTEIKKLTAGLEVDAGIEALGTQQTFETALSSLRPAGTVSSLGVYSGKRGRGAWIPILASMSLKSQWL